MNLLDFVLVVVLALALIRGLMRGMIRQVASLLGILAGFLAAGYFYLHLSSLLKVFFPATAYLDLLSYGVIFITAWIAVILLGFLAVRLSRLMMMSWADRLLGGIFGLVKATAVWVVLVAVLTLFLPDRSPILARSLLAPHVQKASHHLVQLTPEKLRHQYQQRQEALLHHLQASKIARGLRNEKR